MKKRGQNENSLKNLKKFDSNYQPTGKAKSEGKKKASAIRRARADMKEDLFKEITEGTDGISESVKFAKNELLVGNYKPMFKLLKLIAPPDTQKTELTTTGVQIFVADEEHKKMLEDL